MKSNAIWLTVYLQQQLFLNRNTILETRSIESSYICKVYKLLYNCIYICTWKHSTILHYNLSILIRLNAFKISKRL